MKYCTRCCLPETVEGITFDSLGVCAACQSYDQKSNIDWKAREAKLKEILYKYKYRGNYDCIVPISGGKDSTFQLHVITKVYKLKALAVTFSHNWFSDVGKYNLENALEKFDVDHIMYTPKRSLVNNLARKSLYKIGDSCWHCHAGVGAFPVQIAVKFNIPLIIYGESVSEESGRATLKEPIKYDKDYFLKQSSKCTPEEMCDVDIRERDLSFFKMPKGEFFGIHLADYINWNTEAQVEFVKKEYGWRGKKMEGTYKNYKSVECKMAPVHDYSKYLKRGFGRCTDQAAVDIRTGRLTREQAFKLIKKYDHIRPKALDLYLEATGMCEEEFGRVCKSLRKQ